MSKRPKHLKQLLITQSKWTHMFQLDEDCQIRPIHFGKYQEITLSPLHTPSCFFDFPGELIMKVLQISFYDLLHSKNFEDAFDLLLTSKSLLKQIYIQIYGLTHISTTEMARHMHASLFLVELFHDEYLCAVNENKVPRTAIRLETCRISKVVAPWDFFAEIQLERHSRIVDKNGPANPYLTGPYHGDKVNVYGKSSEGIVYVEEMHHPVFTLILSNCEGAIIPDETDFWHNRPFKRFARLLKIIFGRRTGIYFMVKPYGNEHSPFVTQSDTYYKFY